MPESIEVVIDIRIPPAVREQQFYAMMQDWCERVGPGVSYKVEYLRFTETHLDALIDPTYGRALSRLTPLICLSYPCCVYRIHTVPEIVNVNREISKYKVDFKRKPRIKNKSIITECALLK